MGTWYQAPLSNFSRELESVRRELTLLDAETLAADIGRQSRAGRTKAFIYVWMSGSLERFVSDVLERLVNEVNGRRVSAKRLQPGLMALLMTPGMDAVRQLRNHEKLWGRKCSIFEGAMADAPASFDSTQLPLDGKTLRIGHFTVIWQVFGFASDPLPSARHRLVLEDLANGRNEVAHGEQSPELFGRGKAVTDVRATAKGVEDIALHLVVEADSWLAGRQYLRI